MSAVLIALILVTAAVTTALILVLSRAEKLRQRGIELDSVGLELTLLCWLLILLVASIAWTALTFVIWLVT